MSLDLSRIQVIVYDLDGTIYDDTRHFELYAKEIQSHLPVQAQGPFWDDYNAVLSGQHPALRIGTFYDVARDLVLEIKGGNRVVRALHWDGSQLPPLVARELYQDPVETDHRTILNVGDLWWVPSAISTHYGGLADNHAASFLRIRDVMSAPDFEVSSIPGLDHAINRLHGRVIQILATNSPQPDSEAILAKVGLLGQFDQMYFTCNKPAGLKRIFREIADQRGVPLSAILSVGDNLINEIAPAQSMGCQTIFIDPFGLGDDDAADMTVPAMRDLIPTLIELAKTQGS